MSALAPNVAQLPVICTEAVSPAWNEGYLDSCKLNLEGAIKCTNKNGK